MVTLAEMARRLKPAAHGDHDRAAALPSLILMTDPVRLPDPLAVAAALPPGAAVILRHYDAADRVDLAKALAALCRRCHLRLLIAADPHLAVAVGAHGLHLPEALVPHRRRWTRSRRPGWLVTAAAHGPAAIVRAATAGVDAVLLSPVFPTASHPGAATLGPLRFTALVRSSPLPVYALGGISTDTVRRLAGSGAAGFAAIGAFAAPQASSGRGRTIRSSSV